MGPSHSETISYKTCSSYQFMLKFLKLLIMVFHVSRFWQNIASMTRKRNIGSKYNSYDRGFTFIRDLQKFNLS